MRETMAAAAEVALRAKEQSARRGERNMATTIGCERGGELVVLLQMSSQDRDSMLALASMAAVGYAPDILTLVFESWAATALTNPLTGEPWQSGEMQDAVENHGGLEKGWIQDALMVHASNRAGDSVQRVMPYQMKGRRLSWTSDHMDLVVMAEDKEIVATGVIPDSMRRIMSQPTITQGAAKAGFPVGAISPERVLAHSDCAATKVIGDPPAHWLAEGFPPGVTVALKAEAGSVREQIIKESLGGAARWTR